MNKRTDKSSAAGKSKKNIIIATISILVIALSVFLFSTMKESRMIKQADSLVAIGKFENGIAIYDNLLTKKYSDNVMEKRERALERKEANENYNSGVESLENGDQYAAIKYFLKVPENDEKLYQKAQTDLKDIEETTSLEIEELIEENDFDGAQQVINNYLKVSPRSIAINNLKDTVLTKEQDLKKQAQIAKEEEVKKAKADEEIRKNQEIKAVAVAKSNEAAQRSKEQAIQIANNLRYSNKSIVTDKANLRDAPTLKGNLITALQRGTEVYIYDTQVESADRIWCKVQVNLHESYYEGWISYNTMNYTLP